jgi:hypothetical protein
MPKHTVAGIQSEAKYQTGDRRTSQDLIQEVLYMLIGQALARLDDLVQIG